MWFTLLIKLCMNTEYSLNKLNLKKIIENFVVNSSIISVGKAAQN